MNLIYHAPSATKYPYTLWQLRQENPNVSFPDEPTAADLQPFNAFWVKPTPQPTVDLATHRVEEAKLPTHRNDGSWVQAWVIRDATPEEAAAYAAANAPQPDWDTFESVILQSPDVKNFVLIAAAHDPMTASAFSAAFFEAKRGSYNSFGITWKGLVQISPVKINVAESMIAVAKACHLPKDFIEIIENTVAELIEGSLTSPPIPDWDTFESLVLQSSDVKQFITYAATKDALSASAFPAAFFEAKNSRYNSFSTIWSELLKVATVDNTILSSIVNIAHSCDLPEEFIKIFEP